MPDNGVILVFTDTGSKQLELENVIKEKMEQKNVKIFFALYHSIKYNSFNPTSPYHSYSAASLEVYKRLSKGEMFYASQDLARYGTLDLDSEKFFKAVVHTVRNKL